MLFSFILIIFVKIVLDIYQCCYTSLEYVDDLHEQKIKMASSQISLPSTPQNNSNYDVYMQSLQQKLSSISMQNASTLLHVDSSGASSGTATTEMLSPVREFDTISFPSSQNETPKHKNLQNLNNELSKINARKDSIATTSGELPTAGDGSLPEVVANLKTAEEKSPTKEKSRRVSRFKVSVVQEPDVSKLNIPEKNKSTPDSAEVTKVSAEQTVLKESESAGKNISASLIQPEIETKEIQEREEEKTKFEDSIVIINNTMQHLQETLKTSTRSEANSMTATVTEWNVQNHAVGNTSIGTPARILPTVERKISMDIAKTKTTTSLKKSLSYNDLANEIANLFSKPSPKLTKKVEHVIAEVKISPEVANSNPRKVSGGRRMSKTFRRTPTIIIHPPEENLDRITNSCPNIHSLIFRENGGVPTFQNYDDSETKDELNHSCPDINMLVPLDSPDDQTNLGNFNSNLSRSCPDINSFNDQKNDNKLFNLSLNDLSESNEQFSDYNLKNNDSYLPTVDRQNTNLFWKTYESKYQNSPSFCNKKSVESVVSFTECLNELDALKNEVNDIKKECECLLFQCPCQNDFKSLKNDQYFHDYSYKPQTRLKLLNKRKYRSDFDSKYLRLDSKVKQDRKISFKSNKQDSYTRTSSEPNLFKNIPSSNYYNRSFSEIDPEKKQNMYSSTRNLNSKPVETPKPYKKSPKKHDVTPTDLLRNKIKQSLSMFDLNLARSNDSYGNYFTIHGGMKFPKDLTDFSLKNYKDDYFTPVTQTNYSDKLDRENNLLAIVKCCCGLSNCQNGRLQVVPITFQQLLDSNSEFNMNESFEEMLSRQQAELNALIEAHRKQQIEYMKSITDVSKSSGSKREC